MTDPKENPDDLDLLGIPWFLSFKNPAVVAAHAERHAGYKMRRQQEIEKSKAQVVVKRKPAKSVATAPEVIIKVNPNKSVDIPKEPVTRGRPGNSKLPAEATIVVSITDNPHKAGSQAYGKTQILLDSDGMTVAEYCATQLEGANGNWQKGHLTAMLTKGWITVTSEKELN